MTRAQGAGLAGLLACAWLAAAPAARAEPIDNDTCLSCHGDGAAAPLVDAAVFGQSIHAAHQCISCHTDVATIPHATPVKPVSCAQCHGLESEIYRQSDHGQAVHRGVSEAASCKDCHGEPHAMRNSRNPASPIARANIPETCGKCHGQTQEMARFKLNQAMPVQSYLATVHGLATKQGNNAAAVCTDCHGSHDLHRATNPQSKLYWQHIPATCGKCHENIRQTYSRSVHGEAVAVGKRDAPVCTDCHGEHSIDAVKQATASVFPSHIPETCGQCHGAERIITKYRLPSHVVDTYMDSFHGLSLQLGSVRAANCASCHGAHDILPSNDPRSSVYPANLARTCGQCHPGVSAQVAKGQIHSGTQPGLEHRATSWVRWIYLWLFIVVLGGMFVHNMLDFIKKLRQHYQRQRAAGRTLRMSLNERIQHAVLALAFVALAYTGFALKFPQSWWASPFVGQVDWRSLAHRGAAVLFVLLSLYHGWFMLATRRGRAELRALWPGWQDLADAGQMLMFYLGRRADRPIMGKYSYVEKSEYWALVWGSIVMTATGALMVWSGWTLRIFPKWMFDAVTAVHYYEAILACLAIVLWHLYFSVFDPDEYPMKWTWITGHASEADQQHRRPEDEGPDAPDA